jgi:hypothetical protein
MKYLFCGELRSFSSRLNDYRTARAIRRSPGCGMIRSKQGSPQALPNGLLYSTQHGSTSPRMRPATHFTNASQQGSIRPLIALASGLRTSSQGSGVAVGGAAGKVV